MRNAAARHDAVRGDLCLGAHPSPRSLAKRASGKPKDIGAVAAAPRRRRIPIDVVADVVRKAEGSFVFQTKKDDGLCLLNEHHPLDITNDAPRQDRFHRCGDRDPLLPHDSGGLSREGEVLSKFQIRKWPVGWCHVIHVSRVALLRSH